MATLGRSTWLWAVAALGAGAFALAAFIFMAAYGVWWIYSGKPSPAARHMVIGLNREVSRILLDERPDIIRERCPDVELTEYSAENCAVVTRPERIPVCSFWADSTERCYAVVVESEAFDDDAVRARLMASITDVCASARDIYESGVYLGRAIRYDFDCDEAQDDWTEEYRLSPTVCMFRLDSDGADYAEYLAVRGQRIVRNGWCDRVAEVNLEPMAE